jgi:hypothetical protein
MIAVCDQVMSAFGYGYGEAITVPGHEMSASKLDSAPEASVQSTATLGRVETLSTEFVSGWASVQAPQKFAPVYATLEGEVIAFGAASMVRPDLEKARHEGRLDAYAFMLPRSSVPSAPSLSARSGYSWSASRRCPGAKQLKIDRSPCLRLFLMGSPRSGTSQLGATLTRVLGLLGWGRPRRAVVCERSQCPVEIRPAENGLVRPWLAELSADRHPGRSQRLLHMLNDTQAIDKTPGVKMIAAAPFLVECFPGSHFIFLRRHPVANISSRLVKFGGNFEDHCRDWAAAMNEWLRVRTVLPHYLEIQQEDMLEAPERVARVLADYIGIPASAEEICESLKTDRLEQIGAGAGKTDSLLAGWNAEQVRAFDRICGPAMRAYGYS